MHSKIIHSHYNAQQSVAPAGPGWCPRWSWGGCGQGCPLCLYQQLQHYSLINVKLAGSVWSCCLYVCINNFIITLLLMLNWHGSGWSHLYVCINNFNITVLLMWKWLKLSVCLYQWLQHYCLINVKLARVCLKLSVCLYRQLQQYCPINLKQAWVWLKSSAYLFKQLQQYCLINVKWSWHASGRGCLYVCLNNFNITVLLM